MFSTDVETVLLPECGTEKGKTLNIIPVIVCFKYRIHCKKYRIYPIYRIAEFIIVYYNENQATVG